eukprot:g15344.t1
MRRESVRTAESRFLGKVVVKPYGVLGKQLKSGGKKVQAAALPEKHRGMAILDPAGLPHITGNDPGSAGGASGAIYAFAKITSFPPDVVSAITKEGQAKYHTVIVHVVGPDFRRHSTLVAGPPAEQLAAAYHSALQEHAKALAKGLKANPNAKPGQFTLRLLPVSADIFAGPYKKYMDNLTAKALDMGFELLGAAEQQTLLDPALKVELCIFEETEFQRYQKAVETWKKTPSLNAPQIPVGPDTNRRLAFICIFCVKKKKTRSP